MDIKTLADYCYKLTGETLDGLFGGIALMYEDFLLDDRDEDENTIPFTNQIYARLQLLEEAQESDQYLHEIVKDLEQQVLEQDNKIKQLKQERDYYKYEYETGIK